MRIGQVDVALVGKELFHEVRDDNVTGMAAQAAYQLIFALPPLLIFFAALSALVDRYTGVDVFGQALGLAEQALPASVYQTVEIILGGVQEQGTTGLLSLGFILALWSASGAVNTMIALFNRAYDVTDTRSFITKRLLSIGLTIGLAVLVIGAFVLAVFGQRLGVWIAELAGLGSEFTVVWDIARWPAVVIFVMLALAIFYWAGPDVDTSIRWLSPGAVVATILWLLATFGFSLYLRVSDPGSAYGVLGTLVVLLFFLYVSSVILLLGCELNAVIDKHYDPALIRQKAAEPERHEDADQARARAAAFAQREGKAPEEVGLTAGGTATADRHPAPSRAAVAAVVVSLASLFVAAVLGAFSRLLDRRQRGPA
ncbi:MAG: YihY/virulence factor BrkB family protein [Sphaerobacter sp.]|nr:YihY/virulence factor BrkB family protein [Sphaerobacter sp.]